MDYMDYWPRIAILIFAATGFLTLFSRKYRAKFSNDMVSNIYAAGCLFWAAGFSLEVFKQDAHQTFKAVGAILFVVMGIVQFTSRSRKI